MSMLSLGRGRRDSRRLEETPLGRLAKSHFRLSVPPQYTGKDIKQPLLKDTPDSERETVLRIWKVILKFLGDVGDYKQNMDPSNRPNYGSVMARLYRQLGVETGDGRIRQKPHVDTLPGEEYPPDALQSSQATTRIRSSSSGTLGRLKATLSQRIFRKGKQKVLDTLPLCDTLVTPLEQVHYIVGYAILKSQLRDEIYCHVCRQLVNNPHKSSSARGWLLLALLVGCCPPSAQILETVEAFIEDGPPLYASVLAKLMKRTIQNGTRFQPPSFVELEAALQKVSIELQVTLMDGTSYTMNVDGATTSRELCGQISNTIGLKNSFGFALFIAMQKKVASLGYAEDHVLDAISQCEQMSRDEGGSEDSAAWRVYFRKELFSPWDDMVGDIVAVNLAFSQLTRGLILGEYCCDNDSELAVLAAQQYYIEYGAEINEDAMKIVLPSLIPEAKLGDEVKERYWRKSVLKFFLKLYGKAKNRPAADRVKFDMINFAKKRWSLQFSRYYDVTQVEGPSWNCANIRLGVNSKGITVVASEDKKILMELPLTNISTIIGDSGNNKGHSTLVAFVLFEGPCLKFDSADAHEILTLVGYLKEGIRQRSRWAIATENHEGMQSGDLNIREGDLVELVQAVGPDPLEHTHLPGKNMRSGKTGDVSLSRIYVLPTLSKPTNEMLKNLRAERRQFGSSYAYPHEKVTGLVTGLPAGLPAGHTLQRHQPAPDPPRPRVHHVTAGVAVTEQSPAESPPRPRAHHVTEPSVQSTVVVAHVETPLTSGIDLDLDLQTDRIQTQHPDSALMDDGSLSVVSKSSSGNSTLSSNASGRRGGGPPGSDVSSGFSSTLSETTTATAITPKTTPRDIQLAPLGGVTATSQQTPYKRPQVYDKAIGMNVPQRTDLVLYDFDVDDEASSSFECRL